MDLENRPVTQYLKLVRLRPDQKFNIDDFDNNFLILDEYLQYAHEKMEKLPVFTITQTENGYTLNAKSEEKEVTISLLNGKSLFEEWRENHPDAVEITFDDFMSLYVKGNTGDTGKNSYEVWLEQGNTGTYDEYHETLRGQKGDPGIGIYELWIQEGHEGSIDDMWTFLTGPKGNTGDNGKDNYEIWLDAGNIGSLDDFLEKYRGPRGFKGEDAKNNYELWLEQGNEGTFDDYQETIRGRTGDPGKDGDKGDPGERGKDNYELWLDLGNEGTLETFLETYRGPEGKRGLDGIDGKDGEKGEKGDPGKDGRDGIDGDPGIGIYELWIQEGHEGSVDDMWTFLTGPKGNTGDTGKNSYEVWLEQGNTGTYDDYFEATRGPKGNTGDNGKNNYELWIDAGNVGSLDDYFETWRGPKGNSGNDGEKGDPGENGKNSYEMWLDLGHEGTLDDFLEAYRGKEGPVGPPGNDGEKGDPGERGKDNYELWLDLGNEGTLDDFLETYRGKEGPPGPKGDPPDVTIDTELNEESKNPIANSAVYARISELIKEIEKTYMALEGNSTINGDLTASTFIGSLKGNAETATKLETPVTFKVGEASEEFDGSSGFTFTLEQIGAAESKHSHNYAGSESVGGAANSAIKLNTAININGTSFDGQKDIVTDKWGAARTISIGSGQFSLDGSKNVSISLDEIGAAPKTHSHKEIEATGIVDCPTGSTEIGTDGTMSFMYAYNNGWPANLGNIINLCGQGKSQIFCEWTGNQAGGYGSMYYRNKRDFSTAEWSSWVRLLDSANWSEYCAAKSHTHDYAASNHTHSEYVPLTERAYVTASTSTNYPTNGTYVPTLNFLSYWNGAYNSNGNSNLAYCSRGLFGTIVTKNAGDYAAASHSHSYLPLTGGTLTGALTVQSTITATGNITGAKVYNAVWNDYAEYFEKGEDTEVGDIVALDIDATEERYIKATKDMLVVGVHSNTFGHIVGGKSVKDGEDFEAYNNQFFIPVGMTGRVKCKVIGEIHKMDEIYVSGIPGVGRAYKEGDKQRSFVGYALENYTGKGIGLIKIKLK